jgi:hypothetical protein
MVLASGSATFQYLSVDHLGTPVLAADFAGGSVWAGGFEPFGRDWQAGTPNGAQGSGVFLRFPGQWFEETWENASLDNDVVYNVHRWYTSPTGRYTRPDPLSLGLMTNRVASSPVGVSVSDAFSLAQVSAHRFVGFFVEEINPYAYVTGNPVKFGDWLGLARSCCSLSWSSCWGDCIREHRLDWWELIAGSAIPKRLVPPFRVPNPNQPLTTPASVVAHHIRRAAPSIARGLRAAGRLVSKVATPLTIIEGFYDWGVIGWCGFECKQDPCQFQ